MHPSATAHTPTPTPIEVDWFTRRVANPLVSLLTRSGIGVKGTRILGVRGRTTGEIRITVVNVLDLDGQRYLVAPRGATHWVRNLRVAGTATLRLGRRVEMVTATELDDESAADEKIAVLRAYLDEWAWEVGRFFGDVRADSPDDQLRAILHRVPAFRIS